MLNLSRRSILKGAAVTALAAPIAGAGAVQLKELGGKNIRWDKTTDVLVVGFGGAGGAAAIEAKDKGADVLIIEKMKEPGGNTGVSGGGIMIPDDVEDAIEYLSATYTLANSEKDDDLLKTFCEEIVKQKPFLESLGKDVTIGVYGYAGFQKLPKASTIKKYAVRGPGAGGQKLFNLYKNGVESRNIPVMCNTPAQRLIMDGDEVIGVIASNNGRDINIQARKAVILTCGGYEFSKELIQNNFVGKDIYAIGNPGNTGDGIYLAQSAGAKLWHMNCYSCNLGIPVPGYTGAISMALRAARAIYVDHNGKRFANERGIDSHTGGYVVGVLDPVHQTFPRIPVYMIFDEEARLSGPATAGVLGSGWNVVKEGLRWSKDNSAEIDQGVILKADTLEELAKKISVPTDALVETVKKWNEDMSKGVDTQFGRPLTKGSKVKMAYLDDKTKLWSAPINKAPYYAMPIYPAIVNTQGGPRRNVKGQVLNVFNEPIPRLYSAGELGSMWGAIYQGACNNAEALVFGRIAGRTAAGEKSRV